MKIERKQNLTDLQKEIIVQLWNAEYPIQLNFDEIADFDNFLNSITNRQHFLLFDENADLKGWLMTFTRENERWFSMIVDSSEQRKGFGTALLNEFKKYETEINGWAVDSADYVKINGENYLSPINFYRKNGFRVFENTRLEKPDFYCIKINWKR